MTQPSHRNEGHPHRCRARTPIQVPAIPTTVIVTFHQYDTHVLLITGFAGICAIIAIAILAARDSRRNRLKREQKPLEERIADIRESAAFMAQELQKILDRQPAQPPDALATVREYYLRLETLAGAPGATPDEIQRLADEALQYLRQNRVKGCFFVAQAEELASLIRRRNAA